MTPTPNRATVAGRVYNDLRNVARRNDRDVAEYLVFYALEGVLARLPTSGQARDLVLKGGVLMAAFTARRPTRDVDLQAAGFVNDVGECERRVRDIVGVELEDGLVFDASSTRGEVIREDGGYSGVRVHVQARLASARIAMHLDINFGDPIWPAPIPVDLPRLLGDSIRLLGYPDHMVLAEKIVTAIQRGTANTRWRDFTDIASIASARRIAETDLSTQALPRVAQHRQTTLRPLAEVLDGMAPAAQPKWAAWRRRQRLHETPEQLQQLLDQCTVFADPVLTGHASGLSWNPSTGTWA